jgi:hypothetical protein
MLNFLQSAGEGGKGNIFLFIPSPHAANRHSGESRNPEFKLDAPGLPIAGAGLSSPA